MNHRVECQIFATLIAGSLLCGTAASAMAQGCEPIRFISPVRLGGGGEAYQPDGEWQLTLAVRRLVSEDWFVGTKEDAPQAPGGSSPVFRIHTVVADVGYALSDRVRLSASIPFSKGSLARIWPDKANHVQHATGVGDLTLMGERWLLNPRQNELGNISFALGIKMPTGSHLISSHYYTPTGAVHFPADQTIQPGDGGWGIILQSRAFRQVTERVHGYAFGSYMISPRANTEVPFAPGSPVRWSVPDVYSVKAGAAYEAFPDEGVTLNLGGRVDGIPIRDLVGGGDDSTIKRTSYIVLADPGLSVTRGRGSVSLSVPFRIRVNRTKSLFEQRTNGLNGGGFAKYLIFLAYSHRL